MTTLCVYSIGDSGEEKLPFNRKRLPDSRRAGYLLQEFWGFEQRDDSKAMLFLKVNFKKLLNILQLLLNIITEFG